MISISILLLFLLVQRAFRISIRWYFFTAGVLLGIIPLLVDWGGNKAIIVSADYTARAVYFLLFAALIVSIFPPRMRSESPLFDGGFSWLDKHILLLIGGYGLWVLLNFFLPPIPSIVVIFAVGGYFLKVRSETLIVSVLILTIGMLFMRAVLHNVSLADQLGVWLFYSIIIWTAYLIRDSWDYRSSKS